MQGQVAARPEAGTGGVQLLRQELTWPAAVGAIVIASAVAFSYPYIVLKLGLGPNVSLLSAFLGALFLNAVARSTRGANSLQNNIIQTAGTSASSTAFMAGVAAAFGYIAQNHSVDVHVTITPWQMFTWLICSGTIGVLFIPLYRKYFLSDPKMIFPDGVTAAEAITVLDSNSPESRGKLRALVAALGAGATTSFLENGLNLLQPAYVVKRLQIGMDWNLLSFGTGMLVGLRVGLSLLLGTLVLAALSPYIVGGIGLDIVHGGIAPADIPACDALIGQTLSADQQTFLAQRCGMLGDYLRGSDFNIVLLWTMWPATAMLLTSGLTAVALRWRSIVQMFREMAAHRDTERTDIPVRVTVVGGILLTLLLAWVQNVHFGMSYLETIVAVLLSLPLMLIGVRVLGETDFGPVSVMANSLQVLFGLLWPQQIAHNLIAAGMAGDANSQAEGTMQDFKTGQLIGSTPWVLTVVQICAIPIGAAAVAIMYPLLIAHYGLGGDGLTAPTGLKLANMAVLVSKGLSAFPPGALLATVVAGVLGVLLVVLGDRRGFGWLPSPAGLGFGLILPGVLTVPVAAGAVVGWLWSRAHRPSYDKYHFTVAAGVVGGDAVVSGLIVPALAYFGVLPGS